jgi:hypothetical protein
MGLDGWSDPVDAEANEDILWTKQGRLAADIRETFGRVCELRDAADGETREALAMAAATLWDAQEGAQKDAEAYREGLRDQVSRTRGFDPGFFVSDGPDDAFPVDVIP